LSLGHVPPGEGWCFRRLKELLFDFWFLLPPGEGAVFWVGDEKIFFVCDENIFCV
jgi:hypothetical protein